MNLAKINFVNEKQDILSSEAHYLCFLAKQITEKIYQKGNFYVLPHLENGNTNSVYFPNLEYSSDFWKIIQASPNIDYGKPFPSQVLSEAEKLLANKMSNSINKKRKNIETEWKSLENDFVQIINNLLTVSQTLSKVGWINILLTEYGTLGSFNVSFANGKYIINLTSRVDFPAGNIAVQILHALYRIESLKGGEISEPDFLDRMFTANFLFTKTKFKGLHPTYTSPLKREMNSSQKLVNENDKYLTELGFNEKIKKGINTTMFTVNEKSVFLELSKAKGKVVSFDKLADTIWGNKVDEKFSLDSIAKTIENIRTKIRSSGVHKNLIHTVRKQGYFLEP